MASTFFGYFGSTMYTPFLWKEHERKGRLGGGIWVIGGLFRPFYFLSLNVFGGVDHQGLGQELL
jgi:hypothetical protein